MVSGVRGLDDAVMKENDDTPQPSPAEDAGRPQGEDRPATEGPAIDGGSQAGPPPPGGPYAPPLVYRDYRPAPRLTRRLHDKVIGGVGGGIADYFGVDPLLVRLALVGLALVGGGGVLLYVLGWIFIPARGVGEHGGGAAQSDLAKWLGIGLLVIAAVIFASGVGDSARFFGPIEHLFFALVFVGLGIFLLREPRRAHGGGPAPPPPPHYESRPSPPVAAGGAQGYPAHSFSPPPPSYPAPGYSPPPPSYPSPPPRYEPSAEGSSSPARSRLGLLTLAVALLVTGSAALLNNLGFTNLAGAQLGALALLAVGAGVLIGAWWGRARWLIAVGLLLLPFVAFFSIIDLGGLSWRGDVGRIYSSPENQADIDDGFELLAGDATIDLDGFEFEPGTTAEIDVALTFGQVTVLVPDDVYVETNVALGAGEVVLFGSERAGEGVTVDEANGEPDSDARLSLEVHGGFGQVNVVRTSEPPTFQDPAPDEADDETEKPRKRERERP